MFRWAASVSTKFASTLSETFAPLFRSHLEQLQDAWKKVEADCKTIMLDDTNSNNMDDPQLLLDSQLVPHLNQLVEALVKEEESMEEAAAANREKENYYSAANSNDNSLMSVNGKDSGKSGTGPCFEYFLNEKILDRLCALGLPDRPLGMRQLITKTVDAVLLNTKHPILPSMSVHMAVKQLLDVCYTKEDHKRRGYKSAFLSLLHTIAKKIKDDNGLAGIFFDVYPAKENRPSEFLLFTALCAMMSESANEGRSAYEALLWIVQLPNPPITNFILTDTTYCQTTVNSLCHLFKALPAPMECPLLDELVQQQNYPTLDNFFRRWHYIDTMLKSTYPSVQNFVGSLVEQRFLRGIIAPLLLDNRETVAIWSTNFLKHLAMNTESPCLRRVVLSFLLGNNDTPERAADENETAAEEMQENTENKLNPTTSSDDPTASPSSPAPSSSSSSYPTTALIRNVLIKRLDSLSEVLCMHTLDLFATLIGLRDPWVIENLVLRNLNPHIAFAEAIRKRQMSKLLNAAEASSAATESCDTLDGSSTTTIISPTTPSPPSATTTTTAALSNDILPIAQSIMFASFVDLPDFAQLSNFEDYLLDAQLEGQLWMVSYEEVFAKLAEKKSKELEAEHKQIMENEVETAKGESDAPTPTATPSSAISPVAPPAAAFYEGLFLSTLCNKLESFYENSFATNLKITAVLSKLAHCPSPTLHQFIFNPDFKLPSPEAASASSASGGAADSEAAAASSAEARLLLGVLASVWNKGVKRASRMQKFAARKEESRVRLNAALSDNTGSVAAAALATKSSVETMEGERFFHGFIVLEEFFKEFYAIAHTKARLFALQKLARLQTNVHANNNSQPLMSPNSVPATPMKSPTKGGNDDATPVPAVDESEALP